MKKINFARIVQRLTRRFKLSESEYEPFSLGETVVPTTDVDILLRQTKYEAATYANLQTTNYVPFFTVPAGKRWHIFGYTREGTTGNCQPSISTDGGTTTYKLIAAGTAAEYREFQMPIVLDEGHTLGQIGGNNAGDTSRYMQLLYYEEDAY